LQSQQASPVAIQYIYEAQQGKSYALNAGIHAAKGSILAFADDDLTVDKHWLSQIDQAFQGSSVDAVGGRVVPLLPCEKPRWFHDKFMAVIGGCDRGDKPYLLQASRRLLHGANFSIRSEIVRKLGGFRTDLGSARLLRSEDTEMCLRLLQHGYGVLYHPDVLVFHRVQADRLTKRYVRHWWFTQGMALARMEHFKARDGRTFFNVPRWRYREVINNFSTYIYHSLFKREPHERFYYETRLWVFVGLLYETFVLQRENRDVKS
jgi:GT2 family glycosyltransferase